MAKYNISSFKDSFEIGEPNSVISVQPEELLRPKCGLILAYQLKGFIAISYDLIVTGEQIKRNGMKSETMKTQLKALRISSLVGLSAAIVSLLLLAYALIIIAPVFRELFMGSQTALPALTSLLLSIPPNVYLFFFALMIVGLVVKEVLIRNKKVTLVVNALIMVSFFPFLFFFIWTMYLPIHRAAG